MSGSGDYISRKTAYQFFKDQLEEETGAYSKGRNAGLRVAMSAVMNNDAIPAADVVEVVRCKDCMYCKKDELGRWCFNDYENELRDDDFCSHGKRKESKT